MCSPFSLSKKIAFTNKHRGFQGGYNIPHFNLSVITNWSLRQVKGSEVKTEALALIDIY